MKEKRTHGREKRRGKTSEEQRSRGVRDSILTGYKREKTRTQARTQTLHVLPPFIFFFAASFLLFVHAQDNSLPLSLFLARRRISLFLARRQLSVSSISREHPFPFSLAPFQVPLLCFLLFFLLPGNHQKADAHCNKPLRRRLLVGWYTSPLEVRTFWTDLPRMVGGTRLLCRWSMIARIRATTVKAR